MELRAKIPVLVGLGSQPFRFMIDPLQDPAHRFLRTYLTEDLVRRLREIRCEGSADSLSLAFFRDILERDQDVAGAYGTGWILRILRVGGTLEISCASCRRRLLADSRVLTIEFDGVAPVLSVEAKSWLPAGPLDSAELSRLYWQTINPAIGSPLVRDENDLPYVARTTYHKGDAVLLKRILDSAVHAETELCDFPVSVQVWGTPSGRPEFTIAYPTDLPVDCVSRIHRRLAVAEDLIRIGAMGAARQNMDESRSFLRSAWVPRTNWTEFLVNAPTGHERMAAVEFLRQYGIEF